MEAQAALEALARKHAELERQLAAESARPHPDTMTIAAIKRQKLRTKDRLAELAQVQSTRH